MIKNTIYKLEGAKSMLKFCYRKDFCWINIIGKTVNFFCQNLRKKSFLSAGVRAQDKVIQIFVYMEICNIQKRFFRWCYLCVIHMQLMLNICNINCHTGTCIMPISFLVSKKRKYIYMSIHLPKINPQCILFLHDKLCFKIYPHLKCNTISNYSKL